MSLNTYIPSPPCVSADTQQELLQK